VSKLRNALLISCLIATWLATIAHAGPLEDGKEAARSGDLALAIRLWEPLALKGDVDAQLLLGITFSRGEGVPQDWAKAGIWFRQAAGQGNHIAEFFLAIMNMGGLGMPKDEAQARYWALRSANGGYAKAQTMVGAMFETGTGDSPKDYRQAMEWYRKAAEQNDSPAQSGIGRLYENGQGVERDYARAAAWYRTASDNPHTGPGAKFSLGRMYENGFGVEKDAVEALRLYCVVQHMQPVAASVLADARTRSADLSKTMTNAQIAEANQRCELDKTR
jgi:TPR repeat protein